MKSLKASQKFALMEWVKSHSQEVRDSSTFWDQLVEMSQKDLGFDLSESSLKTAINAVHGTVPRKYRTINVPSDSACEKAREVKVSIMRRIEHKLDLLTEMWSGKST